MSRPDDIVGYTYRADNYCPGCIEGQLPTGPGETFDGWALARDVTMTPEDNLDEIAAHFGIDRRDETTYDSAEFPKVIFRDQADDTTCGDCRHTLTEVA